MLSVGDCFFLLVFVCATVGLKFWTADRLLDRATRTVCCTRLAHSTLSLVRFIFLCVSVCVLFSVSTMFRHSCYSFPFVLTQAKWMATQTASVSLNMFSLPVLHINTEQSREKLLYNTNSRQIYYAVMLAVGAALPVVCTRWGTDSLLVRWFLVPWGTSLAGHISELPSWHLVLRSTALPAVVAVNMNDIATTLNTM